MYYYTPPYLCVMRKIITYKNYFSDFIKKLSKDEMNKIRRALDLFKAEDKMVLFNAFKKKTQKTPNNEIEKALKLKEEYYAAKRNQ